MPLIRNRVAGCLLWGAVGDALGGVAERGTISLSDDTQLTLATCEAIRRDGRVSPEGIARTFREWFTSGRFTGLGSSTLKALRDLRSGAHWALAGARGEMAAGNGAAMRVAPLAFLLDPAVSAHRTTIRDVCRITHHSDEAYIGALAVLIAIRWGSWPPGESFLSRVAELLPDSRIRDRVCVIADLGPEVALVEAAERFGASGYVVDTVPLALLLSTRLAPDNLERHLGELSSGGGDADTIGSIGAQIVGSHLGDGNLPSHLRKLPFLAAVTEEAGAFAGIVEAAS